MAPGFGHDCCSVLRVYKRDRSLEVEHNLFAIKTKML